MSRQDTSAGAALQRSYRRLLRAYPAGWRLRHGDALMGTLLDQAEAQGRSRVDAADVRDVVGGGAAVRLRGVLNVLPVAVREAAAAPAMGSGVGLCAVLFAYGEWLPPWAPPRTTVPEAAGFGPFATVGSILYGLWLVGVLAVLARRSGVGRVLLGAATLAAVAVPLAVSNTYPHTGLERPSALLLAPLALSGLVVLASPLRRPSPAVVGVSAAVTAAVLAQPLFAYWLQRDAYRPVRDWFYYAWAPEVATAAWVVVVLGVTVAACMVARLSTGGLGVLVATVPWLALALAGWVLHGMSGAYDRLFATGVALAAIFLTVGVLRLLGLRSEARRRPAAD